MGEVLHKILTLNVSNDLKCEKTFLQTVHDIDIYLATFSLTTMFSLSSEFLKFSILWFVGLKHTHSRSPEENSSFNY